MKAANRARLEYDQRLYAVAKFAGTTPQAIKRILAGELQPLVPEGFQRLLPKASA